MKRPAIFFDRDNTIIRSDGYLGDPSKVVLMEGAADAVARARSLGFATIIASNQSGVARGMFGEDEVHAVNRRIDRLLQAANRAAVVDRHEFCPFHPEATVEAYRKDSDLRKPKPGMILAAAQRLALDLPRSWVIGDAPRDIEAGKAAGCRTVLLRMADVAAPAAADEKLSVAPDAIVSSLKEAMDFIEQNINSDSPGPEPPAQDEPPVASKPPAAPSRLEILAEQILLELRRRNEQPLHADFAVSKLLAGIMQVVALAAVFLSYLNRTDSGAHSYLLVAIFVQTLTIALLIMGRQR